MKLSTAIKYRFKYQMKAVVFFFGYFLIFAVIFPLIGIAVTNTSGTISSDTFFAPIFFMIIMAFIGINTDFKLFIQNGMSRNNIFLASLITNFVLSFFFSITLLIIRYLSEQVFTGTLRMTMIVVEPYAKGNTLSAFFLIFIFLLFASSIGSLFGIFNDRVTGFKKLFVLATLILVPILISLLVKISTPTFKTNLLNLAQKAIGFSSGSFHALNLMITLSIFFIVFSIITYLMNYHREIKRINA